MCLETRNGLIFKPDCNCSREQELEANLHFAVAFLCPSLYESVNV